MVHRSSYLLSLLIFLFIGGNTTAQTGFTIVEPLTGDQAGELVLGGSAYLTGGSSDAMGDGWLRLTETAVNQYGYAVINKAFPSSLGVEVDFEFVIWGGSGADGFSIFLFDANYDPNLSENDPYRFKIGGLGGGLGYAIRKSGTTDEPGLTGGYIGFGIDEYGNYTVSSESKIGGVATARVENVTAGVGVRGSEASGYKWLGGKVGSDLADVLNVNGFTLDYKDVVPVRPFPEIYYRRIFLVIDPIYVNGSITHYELSAKMQIHPDDDPVLILDKLKIEDIPADYLKVGFAAVTGGSTHIHEVRNLNVTTPADLWVRKSVDKEEARVGDELVYTVKVMNQFDLQANYLELKDTLPAHFQVESIAYTDDGKLGTEVVSGWQYGGLNLDHVVLNLAPFSEAVFEIRGRVRGVPDDNLLVNTATFDVTDQTGFSDTKKENNTSSVKTLIIKPEITIENDLFSMKESQLLTDMNVLDKDDVDGDAVDLQLFDLQVITPAQPIDGGGVPFLDVNTGDIILPSNISRGEYMIAYGICERINPNNCKAGEVIIRIEPNVILANGDDFGTMQEGKATQTASVLDNDSLNDEPIDPAKAVFSWLDTAPSGMTLHMDGTVEVGTSATSGDYSLHYTICEVINPTNCMEAEVNIKIRNVVEAKDDYYTLVIDRDEVTTPTSVLDNDISPDLPIPTTALRLIPRVASDPTMIMHADGTITLPKDTKVGRYTYSYTVCELANLNNCQDATAIVDIIAKDLYVPNIITPNGDGLNDYLEVVGYEYYDGIDLVVFNSGGVEVYRNTDYRNNWKGDSLPADVYYYILYLKKGSRKTIHKGYVIIQK